MTGARDDATRPAPDGATTAATGTPFPVDVAADRPGRVIWAAFLAGPLILLTHFMVVYLVAEAGCTGDGPGLDVFDPPVPEVVTVAATIVASVSCLAVAGWNYRRWRASQDTAQEAGGDGWPAADADDADGRGSMAFAGILLAALSFAAVVLVGAAAPFLPPC